jgi:hypothetical protein
MGYPSSVRASRAYITSLGTTGVLIASSILLLAVVSTIVAFRGWPGDDIVNGLGSLRVGDDQPSLQITGPAQIAADAAPAAGAVAASPPPGSAAAAAAEGPANTAPTQSGTTAPSGVGQTPAPDTNQGGGSGQGPGGPVESLPGTSTPSVAPTTGRVGDTAEGVTGRAGGTVGGVSPGLGKTVSDTGKAVSDIVHDLGGSVDTTLGPQP